MEDDDAEVEEEWEDSAQFISRDEVKRQVQEIAQQGDVGVPLIARYVLTALRVE